MRDFKIYRPALEKPYPHAKGEYASQMMQHLQDTEEWFKMMNTEGGDRPAMCQLWTMEHHDGRIARLPDQCPTEQLRRESRKREERWLKLRLMTINFKTNNNQKDETEI